MPLGVYVSSRSFFSEIERKKETCKGSDHERNLEDLINKNVSNAKKEMEDEIRSGICGKLLGEEELQGTPSKVPKPPAKKAASPSGDTRETPSFLAYTGSNMPRIPVGRRRVSLPKYI